MFERRYARAHRWSERIDRYVRLNHHRTNDHNLGTERWRRDLSDGDWRAYADSVFVFAQDQAWIGIDVTTGEETFRYEAPAERHLADQAIAGDAVALHDAAGTTMIDTTTGEVLWRHETSADFFLSIGAGWSADGSVFVRCVWNQNWTEIDVFDVRSGELLNELRFEDRQVRINGVFSDRVSVMEERTSSCDLIGEMNPEDGYHRYENYLFGNDESPSRIETQGGLHVGHLPGSTPLTDHNPLVQWQGPGERIIGDVRTGEPVDAYSSTASRFPLIVGDEALDVPGHARGVYAVGRDAVIVFDEVAATISLID